MQYKIPRYIDYQGKIFGPASFKQFLFLLAGMIIIGILWLIVDSLFFFLLLALLVGGITIALAFGKINGQPLVIMIGRYILFTVSGSKTYFWEKKDIPPKAIKRKEISDDDKEESKKGLPTTQRKGRLEKMAKKIETS